MGSLVGGLMSAMWASKFLATFWEVGLYWQVKVFQIIFDVELRKLPVAVQARDSPCCHNVDPLDIPTKWKYRDLPVVSWEAP
jgi:hypothetical protein